jgi:hypothetical protein
MPDYTLPDGSLQRIAEAELANVHGLMAAHLASHDVQWLGQILAGCPDCVSIQAHLERCERQVELLSSCEAETEALW